jgi:hypothetical protein
MLMTRKTVKVSAQDTVPKAWKLRLGIHLALGSLAIAAGTVGSLAIVRGLPILWNEATLFVEEAKASMVERITFTRVVTEYKELDSTTLAQVIQRVASERKIDPLILSVIAEKESAGGVALYRFEPTKFEQLRNSKQFKGRSVDELRMIASSHGPFHVMGYSAEHYCGLQWHRLYDTLTAARCTGEIVGKLYQDTAHIKDPSARVREVFKRYNGTGADAERYADDAMARLAGILYKRVAMPDTK